MSNDEKTADNVAVIKAPETLKKKAQASAGSGGLSRADMVAAQSAIDNLSESYVEFATEDLKALREAFVRLKSDPNPATIEAVYDLAHDIKGQGGSFGYDLMTQVGGSLCDFIEEKNSLSPVEIDVVKVHVDTLTLVLGNKITGDGGKHGQQLLGGLDLLIAKMTADP